MQIRLVIEYDGTRYRGWQLQPNEPTLQGTLETALARLLGTPVRVVVAGRTDAGVHAAGQVACFRTDDRVSPETVRRALNALTPDDIAIRSADLVPSTFDPRRSARSRRYAYRLWNRRVPSPFWHRYAWHVRPPLDVEAMDAAAARLMGEHDFSSFRAAGCDAAHPVRRVFVSRMVAAGDLIVYEVEATAFLRHMVRNIVGTLVDVGQNRRDDRFDVLLSGRNRQLAGQTAPAHGLSLVSVNYVEKDPTA
jgi:tRNA pseudouridine38-40 synthase